MRFKEFAQQSDNENELQRIWGDTFKALGVGGLSDEDAAQQSLGKITFGSRNGKNNSVFKGKQAVRKRLENGQIFQRLEKINDPELQKGIEDARRWLDTHDGPDSSNASATISNLLQKLFGQKHFQNFIDGDFPRADTAKAKVQPQPPKSEAPMVPNVTQPGEPQPGTMGQQPVTAPMPNNPMPPKPAGAEIGMF